MASYSKSTREIKRMNCYVNGVCLDMKVMTVVGTRPELIKLSCVIKLLDKHVNHVFVHTGQNYDYELNGIFFDDLGIRKPNYFLDCAGDDVAESIANIIKRSDDIIKKERPDAFLILGDTNSCLSAYPAKRRQVPIFHMEAGNRCFDMRVPEEINRKLVDHISDMNFVYTEHARRYLLQEGLPGNLIIKTGSPMLEVCQQHSDKINSSKILQQLNVLPKKYFICSAHREENIDNDDNFYQLMDSFHAIANEFELPIIISMHPRTQKKIQNTKIKTHKNITFLPPLSFTDYVCLQKNAFCTISDSGTITEEASIFGFAAVMIRQAHERPEGMDEGTLIMSGLNAGHILKSIKVVTASNERNSVIVSDYDTTSVSHKILRTIYSYTEYINREVWYKHIDSKMPKPLVNDTI